ncbi:MAG: metal-dependent hydrolase [Promethearchaeota archaeon]
MKKLTHEIFSFGIVFLILGIIRFNLIFTILISILGAIIGIIPDLIDFKVLKVNNLHRNFLSHSPLSPIFLVYIIFIHIICSVIFTPLNIIFDLVFILPWLLHLILDSFTKSGIPIFVFCHHLSVIKIYYDDFRPNLIICIIGICFALIGLLLLI